MRILIAWVGRTLVLFLTVPAEAAEPVNIKKASVQELQGLNGVGEVRIGWIIDYRQANDGFESVAELEDVTRIGSATLADLEDRVTIGG